MPGLTTRDFAAADVLGDVLGSQRGALYGLVPAGRALLTQFRFQAKPSVGFGLAIAAFPRGGDPAPLLADMRRVLADAARERRAGRAGGGRQAGRSSPSSPSRPTASAGLARSWSRALAFAGRGLARGPRARLRRRHPGRREPPGAHAARPAATRSPPS